MEPIPNIQSGINAFRLHFDEAILQPLRKSYDDWVSHKLVDDDGRSFLDGGVRIRRSLPGSHGRYYMVSFNDYPLLWISSDDEETYALFNAFFEALAIDSTVKSLADCDSRLVVYCGFFVVGNHAPATNWHVDYFEDTKAFTLITPLFQCSDSPGGLLYLDATGWPRVYRCRLGEAILFGERFVHSTQPYPLKSRERVLVSITFGTDKMSHWPAIERTIGSQSRLLRLPSREWRVSPVPPS